jgi:hypothetical protein
VAVLAVLVLLAVLTLSWSRATEAREDARVALSASQRAEREAGAAREAVLGLADQRASLGLLGRELSGP